MAIRRWSIVLKELHASYAGRKELSLLRLANTSRKLTEASLAWSGGGVTQ